MKDTSVIPKGDYCYTWKEVPSESNNYRGTVNRCPYYDVKNVNGVEFPWCNYLELGGDDILNKHFGSAEETEKHLPLFFLFDGCKECGENVEDEP